MGTHDGISPTDVLNVASSKNNKLFAANRLFVSEFYDAKLAQVGYTRNVEKAREKINHWADKKTNDKIKNLIPSGMLGSDTRLVVATTIYFKSFRLEKFMYHKTLSGSFFVNQNEEIKVNLVHQTNDFKYIESKELACQVLELPYINRKPSMVIYLPEEMNCLAELEEQMTYDNLQKSIFCSIRQCARWKCSCLNLS